MSPLKSYRDPTRKGSSSNQHFSGSMLNFGGVVIWLNYKYIQYFTNLDFPEIFGPIYGLTSATFEVVFFFSRAHFDQSDDWWKVHWKGYTPPKTKHDWLENPTILKIYLLFKMVIFFVCFLGMVIRNLFSDAGPKFLFPWPTRLGLYIKTLQCINGGFPLGIMSSSPNGLIATGPTSESWCSFMGRPCKCYQAYQGRVWYETCFLHVFWNGDFLLPVSLFRMFYFSLTKNLF